MKLSKRQTKIATMISEGKLVKEIAFELGISEHTVEVHRTALYRKAGARNAASMVAWMAKAGLLNLEDSYTDDSRREWRRPTAWEYAVVCKRLEQAESVIKSVRRAVG